MQRIRRTGLTIVLALALVGSLFSCRVDQAPNDFKQITASVNSPVELIVNQSDGAVVSFSVPQAGWYSLVSDVSAGKIRLHLDKRTSQGLLLDLGQSSAGIGKNENLLYVWDTESLLVTIQGLEDDSHFNIRLDPSDQRPTMLSLAQQSGCTACHALDRKVVGPSFSDVAVRYRDDANALVNLMAKVAKGGKESWSELTGGIPMPPYSPRVSDQDIRTIVKFILALPTVAPKVVTAVDWAGPTLAMEVNRAYTLSLRQDQRLMFEFQPPIAGIYDVSVAVESGELSFFRVASERAVTIGDLSDILLDTRTNGNFALQSGAGQSSYVIAQAQKDSKFVVRTQDRAVPVTYLNVMPAMPELARKSGCTACHAIDKKIVGPTWVDVSNFYRNDQDARQKLIEKVKIGGNGNWTAVTRGVPMPPYSPRVSDEDIATLVDFILSLRN